MINLSVIQGTIQEDVKEFATKNGKMFSKFSILNVVKTNQWESKVYVSVVCFGRAADAVRGLKAGTVVTVQGTLSSRKNEITGKYEMSVQADKVDVESSQMTLPTTQAFVEEDLPF